MTGRLFLLVLGICLGAVAAFQPGHPELMITRSQLMACSATSTSQNPAILHSRRTAVAALVALPALLRAPQVASAAADKDDDDDDGTWLPWSDAALCPFRGGQAREGKVACLLWICRWVSKGVHCHGKLMSLLSLSIIIVASLQCCGVQNGFRLLWLDIVENFFPPSHLLPFFLAAWLCACARQYMAGYL